MKINRITYLLMPFLVLKSMICYSQKDTVKLIIDISSLKTIEEKNLYLLKINGDSSAFIKTQNGVYQTTFFPESYKGITVSFSINEKIYKIKNINISDAFKDSCDVAKLTFQKNKNGYIQMGLALCSSLHYLYLVSIYDTKSRKYLQRDYFGPLKGK